MAVAAPPALEENAMSVGSPIVNRTIGTPIVREKVVQAAPVAFGRERTIDRVADLTAKAATERAQLVVFPEAFVSGYPKGADFGTVVGSRSREGREWFRRYHESSVDIPGPALEHLAEIGRANAGHGEIGV